MSNRKLVVVIALLLATVSSGYFIHSALKTHEASDSELAQKGEWSILQGLEWDNRQADQLKDVIVIERVYKSQFHVAGFPRTDRSTGYGWIILNPRSQPSIKTMPANAPFKVTSTAITRLANSGLADPIVVEFLKEHISD